MRLATSSAESPDQGKSGSRVRRCADVVQARQGGGVGSVLDGAERRRQAAVRGAAGSTGAALVVGRGAHLAPEDPFA